MRPYAANSMTQAIGAALLATTLVSACSRPSAPAGVTALSIADPRGYWAKQGFVRLVPPVHAPSSDALIDQVEIWAKIPDDGVIERRNAAADGAPVGLVFPAGSVLERVEFTTHNGRRFVVDVRGTRIDAQGEQLFHVYRRGEDGLFGFEWARSDAGAQARATQALQDALARLEPASSMKAPQREALLKSVAGKNACAACHVLSRPTNATHGEYGLVNRGTDASGFFTPWTVFADRAPLETYGAHDRSETDQHIAVQCPDGSAIDADAQRRDRCPGGVVAEGRYDVNAARAHGDPRAAEVCKSREFLGKYLSSELEAHYRKSLQDCADSSVTIPASPG